MKNKNENIKYQKMGQACVMMTIDRKIQETNRYQYK